jgi:hypothetical protein
MWVECLIKFRHLCVYVQRIEGAIFTTGIQIFRVVWNGKGSVVTISIKISRGAVVTIRIKDITRRMRGERLFQLVSKYNT